MKWARKALFLAVSVAFFGFSNSGVRAASCDYTVNNVAGLLSAKNTIRSANNNMTKDIVVCLKGGNYYLDNTISFTPEDSGTNGYNIVYKNYPGEKPILIGGQRITNWQHYSGNIYKTHVGSWRFYALMENGQFVTKAREPNREFRSAQAGGPDGINYASGDIPSSFDDDDAQLYIKTGGPNWTEWWTEVFPITNIDRGSRRITVSRNNSQWPFQKDDRYYLRGSLDFLDQSGEYHLDESSGTLYYWPKKTPIGNQEIIAPKLDRIIELKGSSLTNHVKNIKLEGLTLVLTDSYKKFDSHEALENGMIFLENADSITIQNCQVLNSGDSGIVLNKYAQNNIIQGNLIENIAGYGINLEGLGENDIRYVNKNNIINNNLLNNGYLEYAEGSKLWLGYGGYKSAIHLWNSGDNEIIHNQIKRWPYSGIAFANAPFTVIAREVTPCPACWDYMHSRDNYIAFNDISQVMEDANDGGGIYNFGGGKNNVIDNNRVHDITSPVPNSEQGTGIYLDEYSSNWIVKNNVIYGVDGSKGSPLLLKGPGNKITNNIVVDNPCTQRGESMHIYMAGKALKDATITKNIFYRQGGHWLYHFYSTWKLSKVKEADDNLFYHPGGDYYVKLGKSGEDVSLTEWRNIGYDQHSIVADPKFVNRANRDYRLQSGSPAFALGFKQIDTSKVGLCGLPWNSKQGCYSGSTPTPTIPSCPNGPSGNLNCDSGGLINGTDLSVLLTNWHPSSPAPTPKPNYHSADLNSDNKVDGTDLSILLSNWKVE